MKNTTISQCWEEAHGEEGTDATEDTHVLYPLEALHPKGEEGEGEGREGGAGGAAVGRNTAIGDPLMERRRRGMETCMLFMETSNSTLSSSYDNTDIYHNKAL